MAKKIQDGNQIVTNVDSNDNLTFSIKDSFIDSTPTTNSTNLVTSGGVKSALDINTTNIGPLSNLTTTNKTSLVNAVNEINAPGKWVSVGAEAPENGERVWFEKGKNLFDGQLELGMYDETGAKATNNANYRNVAPINVQPSTTYTFSINGTSQKYVIYLYKKDGTFIRVNTLTSGTFTTPAEAYLLNFRCFNTDFTSDYANLKIQLEQGSTATTYEPYIEKSIKVDYDDFISISDLISVGATAPTDGKRVWFRKSNNLFNNNAERKNAYIVNPGSTGQVVSYSYSSATYSFVNCCKVGQGKTYTIRWKQNQTPASTNGRQGCIVDNDNIVQQYMVTWHDGENYDTFTANANGFLILGTDIFATNIQIYESDIEEGIYVDEEEWYSKPKVLWESSTGVTSGSITLNESIENYSYIEVEYSINTYSSFRGVARLTKNSSTSTVGSLVAEFGNGTANGIICWTARIVIDNANATIERNYCLNFTSSGNTAMSDNYIRVLKILGYKE